MGDEKNYSTGLVKVTNTFAPMIERQLSNNGLKMDPYSKQCVVNAISAINTVLDSKGIDWSDPNIDRNNLTQILLNIAALKLNAAASPREVYFQLSNEKVGDTWKKKIEMGIEGDGNDAILARYGRDVEKVGQYWLVREGDDFEYPFYNGFEVDPPKWRPKGTGEVIRIVYPIKKVDGTIEYHISERDDVAKNLIAHISNNLMNETFGFAKDRYNATAEQKKQIAVKKSEILNKVKELGLNALDDPDLHRWISPAWKNPQSREQMIIRKMRNNIVKKIPKDFRNAFVEMVHNDVTDLDYSEVRKEITEKANSEYIDVEIDTDEPKEKQEPEQQNSEQEQLEEQEEVIPITEAEGPDF